MHGLLAQPVFTVGDRTFFWRDVVIAARRWSSWAAAERRTREGIACRMHAEQAGDLLDDAEVERAAAAFRYERGLVSADELRGWLARWDLTHPYWMEYIRRSLLRQRWTRHLPELVARHPVADDEAEAFLGTEVVCSGSLERDAAKLAQRIAIADAVAEDPGPHPPQPPDPPDLDRLDGCFERFCAGVASAQAIEREVHARHVDWLRLECRWMSHGEEDVVREAALCVREDGRDLAQVAAEAGARTGVERTYLESVDATLRAELMGARPGDLIGPLALGDGFQLLEVLDKQAPSAEDPEIRDRAVQMIVSRAVEGEVVNRVRWHEHLQS